MEPTDRSASPERSKLIPVHPAIATALGQVYSFNDCDGIEYHFDVAAGYRLAKQRAPFSLFEFVFRECRVDMKELRRRYPDISESYARSLPDAALQEPILFVPWKGQHLLIDGWHRLTRAVLTEGVNTVPAFLLTEEEKRQIIIAKIMPGVKPKTAPESRASLESLFTRRFPPGQLVATVGAMTALGAAGEDPLRYLLLHLSGEWGVIDAADRAANERAVESGERILSSYRLRSGTTIWIITEADRSSTTILLPAEY